MEVLEFFVSKRVGTLCVYDLFCYLSSHVGSCFCDILMALLSHVCWHCS